MAEDKMTVGRLYPAQGVSKSNEPPEGFGLENNDIDLTGLDIGKLKAENNHLRLQIAKIKEAGKWLSELDVNAKRLAPLDTGVFISDDFHLYDKVRTLATLLEEVE